MAILNILKLGHPMLVKKAEPVEKIDDGVRRLAKDMIETMHAAPGLGLSAPQVNISRRLITVDMSVGEKEGEAFVLVNPEILEQEGKVVRDEGCLSVPEVFEKVARPQKVKVRGLDLQGRELTIEATDLLARVLCHEVDHLNGKLFIEWLSPLKRNLIKKKFKRQAEKSKP
jgi:peptide deformylase